MRDISIRRGVLTVLQDYRSATGADDATVARVFSAAADRRPWWDVTSRAG